MADRSLVRRGEIWWASLRTPRASQPGFQRPVVIVSSDAFNASRIRTVVVLPVTSNLRLVDAPGNVRLSKRESRLKHASVVNVAQPMTVDRVVLERRVGMLPGRVVEKIDDGLRLALDLAGG